MRLTGFKPAAIEPRQANSPDSPLRIALVHVADVGGGAERSVLTLHKSLLEAGHESRLFVGSKLSDEPYVYEIARRRPIPGVLRLTRWLENQRGWQALYAPWFRRLHRVIGSADLVHIHSLWGGQYGFADLKGIAGLATRYPTIMTLRDGWMLTGHCACPVGCERWKTGCGRCPDLARTPAISRDATALNWRRKRRAIAQAPLHMTTVSHWLRERVYESPIFSGKAVHVVHNSIDEREFSPGSRTAARDELNLPQDPFMVLLAGQAVEGLFRDAPLPAVEALNRLAGRPIVALVVGRSSMRVASAINLPAFAFPFQERAADMATLYRAADVTLTPSEYETFGRVAAESLACGTPVVAFATGGLTDVLADPEVGWLVATGDIAGLANTIDRIMSDRASLSDRSAHCATWARRQFSTATIQRQYCDLYRRVIAERIGGSTR